MIFVLAVGIVLGGGIMYAILYQMNKPGKDGSYKLHYFDAEGRG